MVKRKNMTVYQIDYDLNEPGQDYDQIHEAIESLGDTFRALDSTWFLESGLSKSDLMTELRDITDNNDQIIISEPAPMRHVYISGLSDWLDQYW